MRIVYKFLHFWVLCILVIASLTGCGGSDSPSSQPVPRGQRILGLDVKETPTIPYATAYNQAISEGVNQVKVSLDWALLEPTAGNYDNSLPDIIELFYPPQAADLAIILRPLDTPGPSLPSDLAGRNYDDLLVIRAFEDFLTNLHSRFTGLNASGKLKWIQVGNEIDAYLGKDPVRWAEWSVFFQAAKNKIIELWGTEVEVGSVMQFNALLDPDILNLYTDDLLPYLDNAVLTYYPLNDDFTVKPTTVVINDFNVMTSNISVKPIILQECGYPSSTASSSSEALQAEFITSVFDAWDVYRNRIPLIDFTWQFDVTAAEVDQFVVDFGMIGSPNESTFRAYLGSLGLASENGLDKEAYQQLRSELLLRNW